MRPLDKGGILTDGAGNVVAPADYKKWRRELINRIGYYCAYCNMPLSHELQVEHVQPKNPPPGFTPGDPLAWDNMLLACGPCNNTKSNKPVDAATYYLPEEHNTHLPFATKLVKRRGKLHLIVTEQAGLTAVQIPKATTTIKLFGLQRTDSRAAVTDIRSLRRYSASEAVNATKALFDMAKGSPTFNAVIAATGVAKKACSIGFFSLWYEAFAAEPLVMEHLINNNPLTAIIPGTAQNCFDAANDYAPIPRNPANTADPI